MVTNQTQRQNWPYKILIVEDLAPNRLLLSQILAKPEFILIEAENGRQALDILQNAEIDLVLMDVMMPGLNGIETTKLIRLDLKLELVPIIVVSSLATSDDIIIALENGADDYISKPFNALELLARVRANVERKRLTDHLDDTESVLFSLARMVEARDKDTGNHCDRLAHYGVVFGQKLGLDFEQILALKRGGILHDIGKLGIPDNILLKKGKLNSAEWEIMKQHPVIGANLCAPLKTMTKTVDIVRHHHEKWDGSGYPDGLAGEEIPLLARIFQIVDVFDALTSQRPYKEAFSFEKAASVMREESSNGYWQKELVESFIDIVENEPSSLVLPERNTTDRSAEALEHMFESGVIEWYRKNGSG